MNRILLLCTVLCFAAGAVSAQVEAGVALCGSVQTFTAATALTPGILVVDNRSFVISAGTTLANQHLLTTGADVCIRASVDAAGRIVLPATVVANVKTTIAVCGVVTSYTAASATANGTLTIGGRTLPIAAGTVIANSDLLRVGADICLSATLNALGQIVAPSSVRANAMTALELCGVVSAFTAATAAAPGSLTIAGRTFTIAAGTAIDNANLITAGADLCLKATLNAHGEIVVPSSVSLRATARVTICGIVDAYTAATASQHGSITIGGRTLRIRAGTVIGNDTAIRVGVHICLDATIDVDGDIVPPTDVQPNRPPDMRVPGDQNARPGQTLRFSVSAHDPDSGDAVRISAGALPANASFSSTPGNPAAGELTFTPDVSQRGHAFTVEFTATDSRNATDSDRVTIRVSSEDGPGANRPPVLHVPGPQRVAARSTVRFSVDASDPDSGDTVRIRASNLPHNASFHPADGNPARGEVTFTPDDSQAGHTFEIPFVASDDRGGSDSRTVAVRVDTATPPPGNRPPLLSVPGPQFVAPGETLRFHVTASDPDGDSVTLHAEDVPPRAAFDPPSGLFTMTPDPGQAGDRYGVRFTATDPRGGRAADTVDIHVVVRGDGEPGPPVISVPRSPIEIPAGELLEFRVTATPRVEHCIVQLTASGLPAGALFDATAGVPATGRFSFRPVESQAGQTFRILFRAADCGGRRAERFVDVVVTLRDGGTRPETGSICVPVSEITFRGGSCARMAIPLQNDSDNTLRIDSIALADGTHFALVGAPGRTVVLAPRSSISVEVEFRPRDGSPVSDRLEIRSSDPAHPVIDVVLRGNATRGRASSH